MSQLGLDFSAPLARRSDPDTSHDAAKRAALACGTLELRVVGALRAAPGGLTAPEIAIRLGERDGSISPRMPRLEERGFVRTTGAERNKARVWVAC